MSVIERLIFRPKSLLDLKNIILERCPIVAVGAKTSRVTPFDTPQFLPLKSQLVDLSLLPKKKEILAENRLRVRGPVSWEEADDFLKSFQLRLPSTPTEKLATILAGVATSCTGEKSFAAGPLRKQIFSIKVMNYQGEEVEYTRNTSIDQQQFLRLAEYQNSLKLYANFKNPPAPAFNLVTDFFIGTEGQLGIVTEVVIETEPLLHEMIFGIRLPSWRKKPEVLKEIVLKAQTMRGEIGFCEFFDAASIKFIRGEHHLGEHDYVFMAVQNIETMQKISSLSISDDQVFQVSKKQFDLWRGEIPRYLSEYLNHHRRQKFGTDAQVTVENFEYLLRYYQKMSEHGIETLLFGHAGDCHLHFNLLPDETQQNKTKKLLDEFYLKIKELQGSPFAEHGVGLLKQSYIKYFYQDVHKEMFRDLKKHFDPHLQFFPEGFMRMQE